MAIYSLPFSGGTQHTKGRHSYEKRYISKNSVGNNVAPSCLKQFIASLEYLCRVPKTTKSTFLGEALGTIYNILKKYLKVTFVCMQEVYLFIKFDNYSM